MPSYSLYAKCISTTLILKDSGKVTTEQCTREFWADRENRDSMRLAQDEIAEHERRFHHNVSFAVSA